MTKDRLADIKVVRQTARGRAQSTDSEANGEKDKLISKDDWDTMDKYLDHMNRIREDLMAKEDVLKELCHLQSDLLTKPSTQHLTLELNERTNDFSAQMKAIYSEIEIIKAEVDKFDSSDEAASANNRIKRDQLLHLNRIFDQIWNKFLADQVNYKEKSKKKYTEYLRVLNTDLPDDVIEEVIEQGTLSEKIKGIILAHDEKNALYEDVKARTEALHDLEGNIRMVSEMFHDLHILVVSQGEMLNNIEVNVGRSVDYAVKAREDITAAQKMKRRAQIMKIGIVVGVIILILLLFFIIKMVVCFYVPFACRS